MQGESSTDVYSGQMTPGRMSQSIDLVNDDVLAVFEYVVNLWICSVFSYLGIVNNIVTIVVFAKMGFQDTVNISMTSIAVWDLVKCDCAALIRLYGLIELGAPTLSKSWHNVTYVVLGLLYTMAGYTSGAMAAYVAIERCLCVSMPFTVRYLLTHKLVTAMNVLISVAVFGSYVISYSIFDFFKVTNIGTNETVIAYRYNAISLKHSGIMVYLHIISISYPVVTFGVMCICTMIITYHLKMASKFRAKTKAVEKADKPSKMSSRDKQVIKMLLVIIVIYIVSFMPRIAFYTTKSSVPEFNESINIFWVIFHVMSLSDIVNSAINIFVFYFMSSQFKSTFWQIFHMDQKSLT